MYDDLQAFRERAARAVAKVAQGSAAEDADHNTRMADAVIAEFAKPTDAMIDAAYERSVLMRPGLSTRGETSSKQ
jgi:hypothetical protein